MYTHICKSKIKEKEARSLRGVRKWEDMGEMIYIVIIKILGHTESGVLGKLLAKGLIKQCITF